MSYLQITPYEDPVLRKLVLYVANHLNQKWSNDIIVRHTEIYDSYTVPHDSYPLLKIYRRYSSSTLENSLRTSEITLAYCLLNVQVAQIPAITNWVDINIREALWQFKFEYPAVFDIENQITCQYRTIMQLGEIVYQLEINFSIANESNTACINEASCQITNNQ